MIRSLWWAAETGGEPPFGTAHLKVHYPAAAEGDRLTGTFPPDGGPYPVVLFLSGINVGQDAYRWLAVEIARAGFVRVTFDRVAIGGHSAGGTVAMRSARFFPGVKAVFSYGAHTMVATMLGWPAGTVLPAQADCPVLLSVGTRDGVIMGSADRYGQDGHATDPVTRTFEEALGDGEHLLAVFDGANHFMIADPVDPTAARAFLDLPATAQPRPELARLVTAFLRTHLHDDPEARAVLPGLPVRRKHA